MNKTAQSERMGKGTAVMREARELAEGADEGGVTSSQSPRSCPAGPGRWGGVEHGVGFGEGFALACHRGRWEVSLVET